MTASSVSAQICLFTYAPKTKYPYFFDIIVLAHEYFEGKSFDTRNISATERAAREVLQLFEVFTYDIQTSAGFIMKLKLKFLVDSR